MDRVRGGRQKYRRNPTVNPYQLMLPQSTSHIAPATLEEIKMLEILLNGEPELLTIGGGGGGVVGCCTSSTATQSETTVVAPSSQSSAPSNEDDKMLVDDKSSMGIGQDGGGDVAKRIVSSQADAQEMLSVLSDIYDKELVSVIGWAKQIPGTFFWWIRLFSIVLTFYFFFILSGFIELPLNDQMKLLQVTWAEILTLQLAYRSIPFTGRLMFARDFWLDERTAKECGASEVFNHVSAFDEGCFF